tara:strand:- start:801 stop:1121 length:321 start_codon:yes stop_codon:yes gene_type:complete
MKKKKLYHKLVRDRIPDIIFDAGKDFRARQVSGDDLLRLALKKLHEEVQEFVEHPCPEEAADIMEILEFVCRREGIQQHTIDAARASKYVTRGGFEMGYLLEWVEE